MRLYLAHGHRHRQDGKWLQHQLEREGHEVYNPFDGDELARELTDEWARAKEAGDEEWLKALCPHIFKKDLDHIRVAQVMVAYYPDESTGTAQEIAIADGFEKPLIVITGLIHPFIHGRQDPVILPFDIEDVKKTLKQIEEHLE